MASDSTETKHIRRFSQQRKQRAEAMNGSFYGQTMINSHQLSKTNQLGSGQVSLDKEMKQILKTLRNSELPEVSLLQRMLSITTQCRTAAHELSHCLQ